jgi:hypothetical protein
MTGVRFPAVAKGTFTPLPAYTPRGYRTKDPPQQPTSGRLIITLGSNTIQSRARNSQETKHNRALSTLSALNSLSHSSTPYKRSVYWMRYHVTCSRKLSSIGTDLSQKTSEMTINQCRPQQTGCTTSSWQTFRNVKLSPSLTNSHDTKSYPVSH